MVLPSKLGELSYPYFLNKITGMSMTEGLASLIASRIYDFFIVLMIFLFVSIGSQSFFDINPFLIILFTALLLVLMFLAFFYMGNLLRWFSNISGKIAKWKKSRDIKSFLWIERKMNEIAEDFYAIKARKAYLPVGLISLPFMDHGLLDVLCLSKRIWNRHFFFISSLWFFGGSDGQYITD